MDCDTASAPWITLTPEALAIIEGEWVRTYGDLGILVIRHAESALRVLTTIGLTTLPALPAMLRRLAPCRTTILVGETIAAIFAPWIRGDIPVLSPIVPLVLLRMETGKVRIVVLRALLAESMAG